MQVLRRDHKPADYGLRADRSGQGRLSSPLPGARNRVFLERVHRFPWQAQWQAEL